MNRMKCHRRLGSYVIWRVRSIWIVTKNGLAIGLYFSRSVSEKATRLAFDRDVDDSNRRLLGL